MKKEFLIIPFLFIFSCKNIEMSPKDSDVVSFAIYSKPKLLKMDTLRDVSVYNRLNPLHLGLVTTD